MFGASVVPRPCSIYITVAARKDNLLHNGPSFFKKKNFLLVTQLGLYFIRTYLRVNLTVYDINIIRKNNLNIVKYTIRYDIKNNINMTKIYEYV